jgi:hypothetical protein
MALRGMWGSFFSRKGGPAMKRLPQRFRSRIELIAGAPIEPQHVSAADLQQRVQAMLDSGEPAGTAINTDQAAARS